MKFRTEVAIRPSLKKIDQRQSLFSIGSCFATEMTAHLERVGVATAVNPLGVMYNPLSIERCLERLAEGRGVCAEELCQRGDVWFHYDTHGDFEGPTPEGVVAAVNEVVRSGSERLQEADGLIVTLGTAWVYEWGGKVVANCHKMPSTEFVRRRLSVAEVVSSLRRVAERFAQKRIILTVSPIRHLGDGLEENSLSKATLRVAASEVAELCPNVVYFPAYEIVVDELRDYRFYADDMTHPSRMAVEYVWERFAECFLSPEAQRLGERFANFHRAATHRPLHPESESWREFCRSMRERVESLLEELPDNDVARRLVAYFASAEEK